VKAQLTVPGIGLTVNNTIQAGYLNQLPQGKWLNVFSFTGLPVGDFMVMAPLQIASGELWNGLGAWGRLRNASYALK